MLALHCLQSWEASQITIGYGPILPTEEKQEENVTKSSEQEETQATDRRIPQPNTAANTLLKDTTIKLEVPAKVRATAGGDETKGPGSNRRKNSNDATAPNLGRVTPTIAPPTAIPVNSLPAPMPS